MNNQSRFIKNQVKDRVKQNTKPDYWPYSWRFDIQGRTTEEVKEKAKRMKEIADERRE